MRLAWAKHIGLTRRERTALQRLLRTGHTGLWLAARARAVLLASAGASVSSIAERSGRDRKWVRHWLERFARERLDGLRDASRSGRPPKFSPRRAA
jgi:hypothetical protein